MRDLTRAEISTLYNDLVGTCDDIDKHLEQFEATLEDLSPDTLSEIDQLMFCCDNCGWWCEASEASSDEPEAGDDEFMIRETDEIICKDCV